MELPFGGRELSITPRALAPGLRITSCMSLIGEKAGTAAPMDKFIISLTRLTSWVYTIYGLNGEAGKQPEAPPRKRNGEVDHHKPPFLQALMNS